MPPATPCATPEFIPHLCGATHRLEDGYDLSACTAQAGIRTIQAPLGHQDVKTTMVYTQVLTRGVRSVRSPVDSLGAPAAAGVVDGNRITPQWDWKTRHNRLILRTLTEVFLMGSSLESCQR